MIYMSNLQICPITLLGRLCRHELYHSIMKKAYLNQAPACAGWGEAPGSWSHVWPISNAKIAIYILDNQACMHEVN